MGAIEVMLIWNNGITSIKSILKLIPYIKIAYLDWRYFHNYKDTNPSLPIPTIEHIFKLTSIKPPYIYEQQEKH